MIGALLPLNRTFRLNSIEISLDPNCLPKMSVFFSLLIMSIIEGVEVQWCNSLTLQPGQSYEQGWIPRRL